MRDLESERRERVGVLDERVVDLRERLRSGLGRVVHDVRGAVKVKRALFDRVREVELLEVASLHSHGTTIQAIH